MAFGAHGLFVLLLAVGVVRAVADGDRAVASAVLTGAELAWYVAGVWFARRSASTGRDGYGTVWLAVLLLGWLGLVALDPNFVWVAFALYFLCFHLLPTAAAAAVTVVVTAVAVAATLMHGTTNTVASILGPVVGAAAASGMALVYRQLLADVRQRRELYDELSRAHHELLSAQGELAALQHQAGAASERARLARDIHDTLAQGFSSIVLLARAGQRDDPETALSRIEETARENLDEARRVVGALTPAGIEDASLASALQRLVTQLSEHTGVDGTFVVDGAPTVMPMDHEVALLRVAQGALANVRLHSRAQRVRVTLTHAPGEVRLDVVDDGVGYDPDAPVGQSFGLRAMRDRLATLGGTLVVESAPGDGTALAATLPVPS